MVLSNETSAGMTRLRAVSAEAGPGPCGDRLACRERKAILSFVLIMLFQSNSRSDN